VSKTFGGLVEVTTLTKVNAKKTMKSTSATGDDTTEVEVEDQVQPEGGEGNYETDANGDRWERKVSLVPFNYLSLDIPPTPLFRDSEGELESYPLLLLSITNR
jgi:hypothetical protein